MNDTAYYIYMPKNGQIKGVVQFVHGMCEYLARYEHFAEFLCGQGFVMAGHDHIGHGKSVNSSDELGFFAEKDGWKCLVKDTVRFTSMLKKRFKGMPLFIIGHSMGSLVLRMIMGKYSYVYDGAVIMDTISIGFGTDAALAGIEAISAVTGKRSRSKLLDSMLFGMSNARIEDPLTRYDWMSTDAEVVKAYAEDPECTFIFTNQAMYDLVMMVKYVSAPDWSAKVEKTLPVLVLAGGEDPVGSYGKYPRELFECLVHGQMRDVEFKLYDGMRHEILNEIGKEKVFADIAEWLEGHIKEGD